MEREMKQRIVIGGAALILTAICIALADYLFFRLVIGVVVALLGSAAVWEFYTLVERKGLQLPSRLGVLSALFYLLVAFCATQGWLFPAAQGLALALVGVVVWSFYLFRGEQPLLNVPLALFGILYGAVCLGFIFNVLSHPMGRWWLAFLLVVAIFTDVGAYFVGKQWGKRRLAARVSPGKTWEGAIGGFLVGVAGGVVVYLFASHFLNFTAALVYAAILSIATQLGDLGESLFKRDVGVKDSNTIPGFGGVLDVVDGLLFVLPIGYLFSLL